MSWQLYVTDEAKKQLKRIPDKDSTTIELVIKELATNPFGGDIQKLATPRSAWRRRVGSYRIFYRLDHDQKIIYVYDVQRRTSTTY